MSLFRWMLANDVAPADVAAAFSGESTSNALAATANDDNLHSGLNVQF